MNPHPTLGDSTKSTIIGILSEQWPISTREIYSKFQKQTNKSLTYQAVFKAIQELVSEGIIQKDSKKYLLNKTWVIQLKEFSTTIFKEYEKENIITKPKIEIGIGISTKTNATKAGEEATNQALSMIKHHQNNLRLILVLPAIEYKDNFKELMNSIKKNTKETPLIGITTSGEIFDKKYENSLLTIIFAAKEENFKVNHHKIIIKNQDQIKECAKEIANKTNDANFGFLFLPGPSKYNNLLNIGSEFISQLQKQTKNPIPLIGGIAADNTQLIQTFQFLDYKPDPDAIIFTTIKTSANIAINAGHGYHRQNADKEYTLKTTNQLITQIAVNESNKTFEPAIKIFAKEIGISVDDIKNTMPFFAGPKDYKNWRKIPCLAKKESPHVLSFPFDVHEDSLIFTGIHKNQDNTIMMNTTPGNLIDSLKNVVTTTINSLKTKPQAVIIFPCAVYSAVVPPFKNEIQQLKSIEEFKNIPIVGAYVNGEIGPYDNKKINFCNGSVVCLAIGKD